MLTKPPNASKWLQMAPRRCNAEALLGCEQDLRNIEVASDAARRPRVLATRKPDEENRRHGKARFTDLKHVEPFGAQNSLESGWNLGRSWVGFGCVSVCKTF